MRNILIGLVLVGMSTVSFGAKAHRKAKKEISPKIKEAVTSIKTACGVAPKIMVDWKTFNKVKTDHIRDFKNNIGYEIKYIADMSKKFCSDAESKALFKKNTKKVVISTMDGSDPATTYAKGTFTIKTTRQSNSGGYKYESTMEEW